MQKQNRKIKSIISSLLIIIFSATTLGAQDWNTNWPVLKTYEGKYLDEVAMPLGGIGTGTVSIGGKGDLRDWELMNRGALGFLPAFRFVEPTVANGPFFALYYKEEEKDAQVKILEGPVAVKEYYGDLGSDAVNAGFPRFEETTFAGAYPLAQINFKHKEVPVDVRLESFNPLVLGDEDKSGIPVAILRYVITNKTDNPIETSIVGMVPNYIGTDGWTGEPKGNYNEYKESNSVKGIFMGTKGVPKDDINWGTMALTTTSNDKVSYRTSWAKLAWNWTFREFYDDFAADGMLIDHPETVMEDNEKEKEDYVGDAIIKKNKRIRTPPATLAVKQTIAPGESKNVTFMLTWHFPNRKAWDTGRDTSDNTKADVGNYYTTLYDDAWDVAAKTAGDFDALEKETVTFVSSLVDSDIPAVLQEAGLFNLNNLRSQTVFRTADGLPYGFEGTGSIKGIHVGTYKSSGWGFGTCTHVWNYESTTPFVFGNLSSKFRETEFLYAVDENGAQSHRIGLPVKENGTSFKHYAADGQMGTIVKAYRDWQLSGDDEKLKELWPNIKKAMAYAWTGTWDTNKDGVMEGLQHNTMDISYVGANPQMAAWYLAALKASSKMAAYLNDKKFEKECNTLFKKGSSWIDANIFNGEYYEQQIPDGANSTGQLGKGCLVDQMVGQYLAHTADLGYVLDKENVETTLKSVMKYNLVEDFNEHLNTFRSFALADEKGLIMASYPKGGLLDEPFPYYTEVMTGFEYSTGAHMLYEGQTENGLEVFKNIRDRYNGYKRNPFNEGEFGHRYARAMAAWAGILAYTGFHYSAVDKTMKLNAKEGKYFWSNGYRYGTITIIGSGANKKVTLTSLNGDLNLNSFVLNDYGTVDFKKTKLFNNGAPIEFKISKRKQKK